MALAHQPALQQAGSDTRSPSLILAAAWAAFVVIALLLLSIANANLYTLLIAGGALALTLVITTIPYFRSVNVNWTTWNLDTKDLAAIAVFYIAVVALFKLAFGVFTVSSVAGLFLAYAAGMLVGVIGPIVYTVWYRRRPLKSIGIGVHNLGTTVVLAILFGAVQFSVTLWGYGLPADPVNWVPLLLMSVTVGLFEAVFFRAFVQGTLERMVGAGPAVALAAGLYALYHVGYGMGGNEMIFLFGLGIAYAVAYRITSNVLAVWPLLMPMGSFFNQLQSGALSGQLPWMSMAGFGDVLALIAVAIFLAIRHERRTARPARPAVAG
jgi:uncharacterized protein